MSEVLNETMIKLDGFPVVVCVLSLADGSFTIGYSASRVERFDEDLAKVIARRNARLQHQKYLARFEAR